MSDNSIMEGLLGGVALVTSAERADRLVHPTSAWSTVIGWGTCQATHLLDQVRVGGRLAAAMGKAGDRKGLQPLVGGEGNVTAQGGDRLLKATLHGHGEQAHRLGGQEELVVVVMAVAVDEELHQAADVVVVDRAGKQEQVGPVDLLQELRHVVFARAGGEAGTLIVTLAG
jgi:hypothetical protein